MADHGTWHAVAADMVSRGYRVLAPDLRGHGRSERAASYLPEDFAADLVETLPAGADIAIGHSLGGLALALAAARLRPARAIYSDPAFVLPVIAAPDAIKYVRAYIDEATAESVGTWWPRWSDADIAAELAAFSLFDRDVMSRLLELGGRSYLPDAAAVPSLVQLADLPGSVVSADTAATLRRRGFETVTVAGAGHCIHRDDLAGFLASLDGWI